jgi:hypothetical protein
MLVKQPSVAGYFYPSNSYELENIVLEHLKSSVNTRTNGQTKVIISPHAGYIYSGIVAGSSYRKLQELDKNKNWKVILLGPSHRYPLRGISVGAYDKYITPLGEIKVSDIAKEMAQKTNFIPDAERFEHSLEVQLPFLQISLNKFEIIPIVVGAVNVNSLAQFIKPYIDDDTIIVVSTDLSHFLPYDKAVETDNICNKAIPSLDIETMIKKGDACGIYGILASMIIAKEMGWKGNFLDYKNSGDTAGDKNRVVGYGAYSYTLN